MNKITKEGKPRFYFPRSGKNTEWRTAEKIVAVIESFLRPEGLLVFSPKRVRNVVNDLEELDVVYQPLGDPTANFDFVQVRDRSGPQGRPWIQQIIGQRIGLGSAAGAAVSTAGFTEPAIRLAAASHLPLRTLSIDNAKAIEDWVRPNGIGISVLEFSPFRCAFVVSDSRQTSVLEYEKDRFDGIDVVCIDPQAQTYMPDHPLSMFKGLVMTSVEQRRRMHECVDKDGDCTNADVTIEMDQANPRFWMRAEPSGPPMPILAVCFHVQLTRMTISTPPACRYRYEDAVSGEELAQAVVSEFEVNGVKNFLALVRSGCDGETCRIGGAHYT